MARAPAVAAHERGDRRADPVVRDRRGDAHEVHAGPRGGELAGVDRPAAADAHDGRDAGLDDVGGRGRGLVQPPAEVRAVHDVGPAGAQAVHDAPGESGGRAGAAADQDASEVEAVLAEQRADAVERARADVQQPRERDLALGGRVHASPTSAWAVSRSASSSISTHRDDGMGHRRQSTPAATVRAIAASYHSLAASSRPTNDSSSARSARSAGPRAMNRPTYSPTGASTPTLPIRPSAPPGPRETFIDSSVTGRARSTASAPSSPPAAASRTKAATASGATQRSALRTTTAPSAGSTRSARRSDHQLLSSANSGFGTSVTSSARPATKRSIASPACPVTTLREATASPASPSPSSCRSAIGRPATGSSHLGVASPRAPRRLPRPAARTTTWTVCVVTFADKGLRPSPRPPRFSHRSFTTRRKPTGKWRVGAPRDEKNPQRARRPSCRSEAEASHRSVETAGIEPASAIPWGFPRTARHGFRSNRDPASPTAHAHVQAACTRLVPYRRGFAKPPPVRTRSAHTARHLCEKPEIGRARRFADR